MAASNDLFFFPQRLPGAGLRIRHEAGEGDRAALAGRLDVEAVLAFAAVLEVEAEGRAGAWVSGAVTATVRRLSVVSLEPVDTTLREEVDVVFQPAESLDRTSVEVDLDFDPVEAEDPPEPFTGGRVDLQPYLVELVSLALDPYPRAEGETFEPVDTDPEPEAGHTSPFADLDKRLGPKDG